MLILGVAGVGKSTIGRRLAIEWPAKRYVDVATIRQVLRERHAPLSLSTYEVWKLAGSEPTRENLIAGFERYAELLWPSTLDFLRLTAEDRNRMVIDGAILSPRLIQRVDLDGLVLHARMLHVADREAHFHRLLESVSPSSPLAERLAPNFEQVRMLQDYMREQCSETGIPVVENKIIEETVSATLLSLRGESEA